MSVTARWPLPQRTLQAACRSTSECLLSIAKSSSQIFDSYLDTFSGMPLDCLYQITLAGLLL